MLEPHGLAIRIWHWIFFVLIFSTITTVGLATFVFNTGKNIPLVQQQLQGKGVTVDTQTARAVSHAFNDKCWELHTWIGYAIVIFVLSRLVLELVLPMQEKLSGKLRLARTFMPTTVEQAHEKKHVVAVKYTYVCFYALILVMALTGIVLAFETVPFFRGIRRPARSVHNFTQYLIYAFILIHITGVIRADIGKYPGLVSGMINGRKTRQSKK